MELHVALVNVMSLMNARRMKIRVQEMIGWPTTRNVSRKRGLKTCCWMTLIGIIAAERIFGRDLGYPNRKTICRCLDPAQLSHAKFLPSFVQHHCCMTLFRCKLHLLEQPLLITSWIDIRFGILRCCRALLNASWRSSHPLALRISGDIPTSSCAMSRLERISQAASHLVKKLCRLLSDVWRFAQEVSLLSSIPLSLLVHGYRNDLLLHFWDEYNLKSARCHLTWVLWQSRQDTLKLLIKCPAFALVTMPSCMMSRTIVWALTSLKPCIFSPLHHKRSFYFWNLQSGFHLRHWWWTPLDIPQELI